MATPTQPFQPVSSPSFDNAPVVETALGIQFSKLVKFSAVHFGLFYRSVSDRFPIFSDRAPISRIDVKFPLKPIENRIQISQVAPPLPRVFFSSEPDGEKLLQVQPDRFGFNWRKKENRNSNYPRYSENVDNYLRDFQEFVEFCKAQNIGAVKPDVCEVVYVNNIYPEEGEDPGELFAQVFAGVEWQTDGGLLPTPEAATMNRVYEIGERKGRLYAEAGIATDIDERDYIGLKMVARTLTDSLDTVRESLDLAHDWAVGGFVAITDPDIRRDRWGQRV